MPVEMSAGNLLICTINLDKFDEYLIRLAKSEINA